MLLCLVLKLRKRTFTKSTPGLGRFSLREERKCANFPAWPLLHLLRFFAPAAIDRARAVEPTAPGIRTRAIAAARVKTDAVDAKTLAHLLRADLLPEAYVAPRDLRDVRELLRHRIALTRMGSALKNRVHAILAKHGITRQHSDLFGKGGREFLAELQLRDAPRRRLDSLIVADRRLRPRDRPRRRRRSTSARRPTIASMF